MFHRNLVERTVDATLEQRESILNRIGVVQSLAVRNYVINHAMAAKIEILANLVEHHSLVRLQQGIFVDVVAHNGLRV